MNLLNKLFGKRNHGDVSTITVDFVEHNHNQVASFIENCTTMEDCKQANIMLDELSPANPLDLRNKLLDITFKIFNK